MTTLSEDKKSITTPLKSLGNLRSTVVGITCSSLALSILAVNPAQAVVVTFGNMFTAATQFDNTVTGSGNNVVVDTWTNLPSGGTSIDRGAYSVSRINGGAILPQSYDLFASNPNTTTSGQVIDISPSSTNVLQSRSSGIEFDFKSPVNALGFEVGDWATCCQPSALYISFDNGAPIQVGLSTVFGDQFLTNGGAGVFVGAIDDSAKFSKVQFWGDGAGEFLVAGGRIRYADVAIGSVSQQVPEPFTIVGTMLGGAAALKMRKRLKATNKL
jgi:hypothetical protein